MKKKLNVVFFSLCFLGSVIAEAYFIQVETGNRFSIIALGVVVLITGYLWMDSIRSKLSESGKEIKSYIDQMYLENAERWNEHYNELQNLQKATYTATKKNTVALGEQLEGLTNSIAALEVGNTKAFQKLMDLQMKSLEGQKKALSLQINYNKENTKQLIKAISDSGNQSEALDLLNKIAENIEDNSRMLQQELQNLSITIPPQAEVSQYFESSWNMNNQSEVDNPTEIGWDVEAEVELDSKTEDWSNSSDLSTEEIADPWSVVSIQEEPIVDWNPANQQEQLDEVVEESQEVSEEAFNWNNMNEDLNNLIEDWNSETTPEEEAVVPELMDEFPGVVNTSSEEKAENPEKLIPELEETQTQKPEIKPLYADPNKALSADEIAALFASFGQ